MTDDELEVWFQRRGLSEEARSLIRHTRKSPPSRRVGGGSSNVPCIYPSELMQESIQAESHRGELAGIYEMEWHKEGDNAVLEYYDQPPSFRVRYENAEGKHLSTEQTIDFFVIRECSAGWEEWATEDELKSLHEKYPGRYYQDERGAWHDSAGEAYARSYGLYYRLRSTAEINWVYQRNIQWLEDYLRPGQPPISSRSCELVRAYVSARPGITLDELFELSAGQVTADDIFGLIVHKEIYVDLYAAPLAEPSHVHIFISKDLAPAIVYRARGPSPSISIASVRNGSTINWDSRIWKVVNVGESKISMLSDEGKVLPFLVEQIESLICEGQILVASPDDDDDASLRDLSGVHPRDLAKATRDCALINNYLLNGIMPSHHEMPERTFFRKLEQYRKAETFYGDGFLGLVPRLQVDDSMDVPSDESRDLMLEFIKNDYETVKQKSKLSSWRQLKRSAEAKGIKVTAYKLFCLAVDNRPVFDQVLKRLGSRAAYQVDTFHWELELTTPRQGDRPFEIVHIDSTILDIRLRASNGHEFSERPTLTLLTDAFSRRVLAFYLSFDKPSYRSCMMVVRECVRRFHRFGQIVVLDKGPEFENTYLDFLVVAKLKAIKKTRPSASPRDGAILERTFGTINTQVIHNLLGHTKIMRNVRQVTKSVNPEELQVWTLPELHECLREYLYEVRDTMVHPALGYNETPRQAFARGLLKGGQRLHRLVRYDRNFLMMTMPTTPKGEAKVIPSRGTKINHIFYWCDAFQSPHVRNKRVPVRYDPYDAGVAFAFVDGQWRTCISQLYAVFKGHSHFEIMLATEELRQRDRKAAQATFTVNAKILAEFMESVEGREKLLLQRMKDIECQDIRASFTEGVIEQDEGTIYPEPDESPDEVQTDEDDDDGDSETYGGF